MTQYTDNRPKLSRRNKKDYLQPAPKPSYWEWAETRPVSYILIHAVGLWAVTQVVYWLLFIKLGL